MITFQLTCDQEDSWCDEGSNSPSILLKNGPRNKHHDEGDGTRGRGEVTHEGGVLVGVGELSLDLALPCHLHQVDADTVCHHLHSHETSNCCHHLAKHNTAAS